MKLVDANVFIYGAGRPHPLRDVCNDVLEAIGNGGIEATVDVEVFQEILHYYQKQRLMDYGAMVFRSTAGLFPDPLQVTMSTVEMALDILRSSPQVQARDAVHAAVVLENDLEGIITADRSFEGIPGVKRFDPKEF